VQPFHISFLAVLIAAVVRSAIGAAWFAPMAFGKSWMQLSGVKPSSSKHMMRAAGLNFIGNFVMAFVLAHAIQYASATTWGHGAMVGFFNWLGFIATVSASGVIFEKRSLKLTLMQNGYQLVSLLVMGAIIASWS